MRHSFDFLPITEPTYNSIIETYLKNYQEPQTKRQELDNLKQVVDVMIKLKLVEKKQELLKQGFQALNVPSFKLAKILRPKKMVWSLEDIWDITHYKLYLNK